MQGIRPVTWVLMTLVAAASPVRAADDGAGSGAAGSGAAGSKVADAATPPGDAKMRLFLLVGQSNMAGRGKIEAEDRVADPRVWMLNKEDQWAPAVDPLHFDKPKVAGVGMGLTFGRVVAANGGGHVGLVPCAVGGSAIEQWDKGDQFYEEAVRRARVAARHGTFAGILWHQGESNAAPGRREGYEKKLEQLIANLRADLVVPDAPVVIGEIGHFRTGKPGTPELNEILRKFPATHPNTACALAAGLHSTGDNTHFDAAAQRELGRRYAAAYLKLVGKPRS